MSDRSPTLRRGSALLIVLGLLSFLMISAVAFSISMRTEYAAASSYRRSVSTRELLVTAFTDARSTVDYALRNQAEDAGFNRNNPESRTVEALAPFRYGNDDRYGRLIASYNNDATGDTSIAYLLDDTVMRHIPPYVAAPVYDALELQDPSYKGNASDHAPVKSDNGYRIDWSASWKPITARIPEDDNNRVDNLPSLQEAVIGRMAWAVVNLSDSLDINAVGSVSTRRGIGLTGSEFAYGLPQGAAGDADACYELFRDVNETAKDPDLPLFASNADIAQFAARVGILGSKSADGIYPYSWEDAVMEGGDGYYSPFSVYSFWPNAERAKEDGSRATGSGAAYGSNETRLSCNAVKEEAVADDVTGTGATVKDLVNDRLGGSGTAGRNLVRMLRDYIDKDSKPELFDTGAPEDLYPYAQPTVERVPMISEIAFTDEGWENDKGIGAKLLEAVEELEGLPKGKRETYTSIDTIPENLKAAEEISITISDIRQMIGLRTYFPGGSESTEDFSVEVEGIIGVTGIGSVADTSEFEFETAGKATDFKKVEAISSISGGNDTIFETTGSANVTLSGDDLVLTLRGEDLPVANLNKETPEQPQRIRLSFLVDILFRAKVMNSTADAVDIAPTDRGGIDLLSASNYPKSKAERLAPEKTMAKLDSQYFRITRPLTVTFGLCWNIKEETSENKKVYTAESAFAENMEPEVTCAPNEELIFGDTKIAVADPKTAAPSYSLLAPERGAWFTVDPRYNWLSPMMGVTGDAEAYGTDGAFLASFSSPHWIFLKDADLTSGSTAPSRVQEDYAAKNDYIVPFVWGLKIEDIRYGHNDSGQLLLPAEIGFLPVPYDTDTWHPHQREYRENSISSYYNTVAKASFFRTIPVVDLKDNAIDNKYVELTKMFSGFSGGNFPEEHRGIVHAFAAQDDYHTCQRLRQFAMLGIPSSISQAATVTHERLKKAEETKRIPSAMLEDLGSLESTTSDTVKPPKYDTFIRDYLFYVPDGPSEGGVDSWGSAQEPYINASASANPYRARTADEIILQEEADAGATFVDKLKAYNEANSAEKLGQNDMTTLLAMGRECFGDRQQLFLYILRADSIAYNSSRDLSQHKTLATARAVALVWRDAYGELPDRVIYYQLLP